MPSKSGIFPKKVLHLFETLQKDFVLAIISNNKKQDLDGNKGIFYLTAGTYYLHTHTDNPTYYSISYTAKKTSADVGKNTSSKKAKTIKLNKKQKGVFVYGNDDYYVYKFKLKKAKKVSISGLLTEYSSS